MLLLLRVLAFLCIFLFVFSCASEVLRDKTNAEFLYSFRQEAKNSLDVLFFGSSHMYRTIYPMQLWDEYGVTSYNLGTSEQSILLSYYALLKAFETQSPKLVVLDVFMIKSPAKTLTLARAHQVFDNLTWSKAKLEGILDVVPRQNWLEFFIPFDIYHSRWPTLKKQDFAPIVDHAKGAGFYFGVQDCSDMVILPPEEKQEIEEDALAHLNKIIDLCKKKNVQLLLVKLPTYAMGEREYEQRLYNKIADVAAVANVEYINYLPVLDDVGIDLHTDMAEGQHVNIQGGEKMTSYLGQYIRSQYNIPDHRQESAYASWNDAFAQYQEYVAKLKEANAPKESAPGASKQ